MAYVLAFAGLAILVGIHVLVLRVLRRRWRPALAIAGACAASYLVIVAVAFAYFTTHGMVAGRPRFGVRSVVPHFPANGVLVPGDRILAVDHVPLFADTDSLTERVQRGNGAPVTFTIDHAGATSDVTLTPVRDVGGTNSWVVGVKPGVAFAYDHDPLHAARVAITFPIAVIAHARASLPRTPPAVDLGGPKRILDEYLVEPLSDGALAMRYLLFASVWVLIAQTIVDAIRWSRRA